MKKNDLYSYVYDFVSHLMEKLDTDAVRGVILFGSVARGDFDKESDVDIFIDTLRESKIKDAVRSVVEEFYAHSRHTWFLRGIENRIKPLAGDLDSEKWAALKREIVSSGIVLYGNYRELPKDIRHSLIIKYDISRFTPREKSRFLRKLLGYRLAKGKKIYNICLLYTSPSPRD